MNKFVPRTITENQTLTLDLLLRHGADITVKTTKEGFTAFHVACSASHDSSHETVSFEAATKLLEHGALLEAPVFFFLVIRVTHLRITMDGHRFTL